MRRKSEYKPLSFTTTLRNPERIKKFLSVLVEFEGRILTNELIDKIVFKLISQKIYIPNYIQYNKELKEQLNLEENFSDSDTLKIINNSPQNHKEANFDKGWPSRFDTWYKIIKEFGLAYYSINQYIEISTSGHKLIHSLEQEKSNLEEQVFLNILVKYQRNNPFRRIKNENVPLILLLNLLQKMNEEYGEKNNGLLIKEIPLLLCWRNNNFEELFQTIINLRKKYNYTVSDEIIYDECKKILNTNNEKRFKIDHILKESVDDFIRKVKLTGIFSIRGFGRFLDINKNEINKINYILSNYSNYETFDDEYAYYKYMSKIDNKLLNIKEAININDEIKKEKLFEKWVNHFDLLTLTKEIKILAQKNQKSNNEILKFINNSLRLEFLTAMILKKKFKDIKIKPNYKVDDEGIPISFAPGGKADIVCTNNYGNVLFEVTLLTGTAQNIREMPAITRHLKESMPEFSKNFAVLVCPKVSSDTNIFSKFIKFKENIDILPISIAEFVNSINTFSNIQDFNLNKLQN